MKRFPWERRLLKPTVFVLALLPVLLLLWKAYGGTLSANPIKEITEETGTWTLRFLMLTLAVTPLRTVTGWSAISTFRRMLGLYAYFYCMLHFTTYVVLDQFFSWGDILHDVAKRPFITVGFASLVLMTPLALTSPNRVVKLMGGKKWKRLHRLVYVVALGGVIHYLWLVKADTSRPLAYGALLTVLLLFRLVTFVRSARAKRRRPGGEGPVPI